MEQAAAAPAWLLWLQDGTVGRAMRESLVLYPLFETLHIIGFSTLFGAMIGMDLRLLGLHPWMSAERLGQVLLPVAIGGFLLAAPTGVLLFTAEAASTATNPAFLVKLALIGLAGLNAVALHAGAWRRIARWDHGRPPPAVRVAALLSIFLWVGAIAGGRLIAYA